MVFDPEAGLYVFEVVLRATEDAEAFHSTPFLAQADDTDEAEEKVMDHLDDLDLDQELEIEEPSEPYELEDYQQRIEENEKKQLPVMAGMLEDELRVILGR